MQRGMRLDLTTLRDRGLRDRLREMLEHSQLDRRRQRSVGPGRAAQLLERLR